MGIKVSLRRQHTRILLAKDPGPTGSCHTWRLAIWVIPLFLLGCALPSVVQRQSVEYNTAVSEMANQLTLLNIVRAKEEQPIFYTSIARLTGSTTVTASGGFNAQLKTASPTDTNGVTTTTTTTNAPNTVTTMNGTSIAPTITKITSPSQGAAVTNFETDTGGTTATQSTTSVAPATTVATAVANATSRAVTSGGNIYMPSIGGQVVSGPSFDINILDTQQFYQGVLGDVPFTTVETFIDQEFDNQLLMRLLIERLEFRLAKLDNANFKKEHYVGELLRTLHNYSSRNVGGKDKTGQFKDEAGQFVHYVACISLEGVAHTKDPKILAPISRIAQESDGKVKAITIRDLALLDGDKLDVARKADKAKTGKAVDLDGSIDDLKSDDDVYIVRTSQEKQSPRLQLDQACSDQQSKEPLAKNISAELVAKLLEFTPAPFAAPPPGQRLSSGRATVTVKGDDGRDVTVDATVDIVFRSPEGVIKFLGQYLRAAESSTDLTYPLDGFPIFDVKHKGGGRPGVSTSLQGVSYYIDRGSPDSQQDQMRYRRYMSVLGLIEELVNLQKSSADHPVTVPVHVLP